MRVSRRGAAVAIAGAALILSGCGQVAEEAAEQAIEQNGGGDVEIDADGDSFSVEGEDGSISVGKDELPENFPSEITLPEGGTIESATAVTDSKKDGWFIQSTYADTSPEDLVTEFAGSMQDGGFEETSNTTFEEQTAIGYEGDSYDVAVIILGATSGSGSTMTLTVTEK